jgi:pimeloyl-ACP methyl ester carboxylesterase
VQLSKINIKFGSVKQISFKNLAVPQAMINRYLTYKNSQISYYLYGSGPRLVVCFHGYGENGSLYQFLAQNAGNEYSFYAIDLPFHGHTKWDEGLNFTHTDLQEIIHAVLLENNHQLHPDSYRDEQLRLTLLGFSLGGRMVLSLYQAWPEAVQKLILLAPDGLKVNFWYWLATRTWVGNRIFSFTMKYPAWFHYFLRAMNKFGLVNASVFKFVNYYIGDKEARLLLYQRWTSLRRLKPNLSRIKSCVRRNKTRVHLIYGQHDRIILPVRGEHFRNGIEEYCTLQVIASGHQILHEKHAAEIVSSLKV